MSKGSAIRQLRIEAALWEMMVETIERRNRSVKDEPWTTSEFIRASIREKIQKMARGRKPKKGSAERDVQELGIDPADVIDVVPETPEEIFKAEWSALAASGIVDALHGKEYHRVHRLWKQEGGKMVDQEWIVTTANAYYPEVGT